MVKRRRIMLAFGTILASMAALPLIAVQAQAAPPAGAHFGGGGAHFGGGGFHPGDGGLHIGGGGFHPGGGGFHPGAGLGIGGLHIGGVPLGEMHRGTGLRPGGAGVGRPRCRAMPAARVPPSSMRR